MESSNKRPKLSDDGDGFLSLAVDEDLAGHKYGFDKNNTSSLTAETGAHPSRSYNPKHDRRVLQDHRHARDRPKSQTRLPGHEPWVLVKTRFGRQFVHNSVSKASLWRIPSDLMKAVENVELLERDQKEKRENARWAEEQLKQMRPEHDAKAVEKDDEKEMRDRRRRSESLQREDEAALMAELEQEANESHDVESGRVVEPRAGEYGYDSDGDSYEYIEVTDSEGEGGEGAEDGDHDYADDSDQAHQGKPDADLNKLADDDVQSGQSPQEKREEMRGPVEFGEDDIAFQLAAMGEDYGLDPGEYGEDMDGEWEEGDEGIPLTEDDAINLFRDLLEDSRLSPFTPWEQVVSDISPDSIVHDGRYTVLPTMKARKEAWDGWTKMKIAQIREERARMEKSDPRIPYLAFLASRATPKLYWPEFKRKFKREPELNDRGLSDKDREKLYRDHISRLKLSESMRKADLIALLSSTPTKDLHKGTQVDSLPSQVQSHLHFISLPTVVRDEVITSHIRKLPALDDLKEGMDEHVTPEMRAAREKQRSDRRRREAALAAREKTVAEDKRKAEQAERMARRELTDGQRELQRAMNVGRAGLRANLGEM